jgi:hypothetical protein
MIEIKGEKIKTDLSEMTLGEFQACVDILSQENTATTSKYLNVLEVLGASDDLIWEITLDELIPFVQEFTKAEVPNVPIPAFCVINDKIFDIWSGEGQFDIKAKDFYHIEKATKANKTLSVLNACAVILKERGVDTKSHNDSKEIEKKVGLLKDQPVSFFYGIIALLTIRLGQQIQNLIKAGE